MEMEPKSKAKTAKCSCLIHFEGLISRSTCSHLATEFFKYILSQREQLPDRLDSLIRQLEKQNKEENNTPIHPSAVLKTSITNDQDASAISQPLASKLNLWNDDASDRQLGQLRKSCSVKIGSGSRTRAIRHSRRQRMSIEAGETIIKHLDAVFQSSEYPIQKMAVLLGSSIVTPRETYIVSFPRNWTEGRSISLDNVKKNFFRQLVTSDFIDSFSETSLPPIQKIFVLIQTWRQAKLDWFQADPRFRIPTRGKVYAVQIDNGDAMNDSFAGGFSASPMEVSGIDFLDATLEQSMKKPRLVEVQGQLDGNDTLDSTIEELSDLEDVIWYRAPITFHGFKLGHSSH